MSETDFPTSYSMGSVTTNLWETMAAPSLKMLFSKAVKITFEYSLIANKPVLLLIKHHFNSMGDLYSHASNYAISEMYMKRMEDQQYSVEISHSPLNI